MKIKVNLPKKCVEIDGEKMMFIEDEWITGNIKVHSVSEWNPYLSHNYAGGTF